MPIRVTQKINVGPQWVGHYSDWVAATVKTDSF